MADQEWVSVPVGIGAERWVTRGGCKKVVVAVHTVVAGQRLLDVVDLVEQDPQVQVVYTRAPDVLGGGVERFLRTIGALVIPWQQAIRERFDLCLAASCGGVEKLHGPLVLLPHGAGYGKRLDGDGPVYGLDAQRLTHDGRVLPSLLVLSHEGQRETLARQCPEAVGVAEVIGDPCYDRMALSTGNRQAYRDAFGLAAGQELVVVTSTWGPDSLFSRDSGIFARLTGELDPRRFLVAAAIHPAVWSGHGHRQVRAWLARAAGLVLVEPERDWRPAVVAADHVVGDPSSTMVYAAAIGRSVLPVPGGDRNTAAGSPQHRIGTTAPAWRTDRTARSQLHRAAAALDPALGARVVGDLTSRPGAAHRVLRERLYRLLDAPMPGRHRRPDPVPVPTAEPGGRRHA
ncbi:hypothetical protein L6E12_25005 [Actinokineospora sp. PR83]|uniref:hypothetical protein n=1 Tax=Actinokineospora sp. PR83 TaxID=2884908 RepID=UPI001F3683E3|nr:hypothetical protein [Actinokineospora sp. PR83]MCG8919044.1 hypothetical protein [Actinokineospora sp. PR83]